MVEFFNSSEETVQRSESKGARMQSRKQPGQWPTDRPVDDMHNVHGTSPVDRSGGPTGTHGLSVGDGRPKKRVGRPAQSTDRRIYFF